MTEIYDEDGHVKDSRDPNYDSDEEEVVVCVYHFELLCYVGHIY